MNHQRVVGRMDWPEAGRAVALDERDPRRHAAGGVAASNIAEIVAAVWRRRVALAFWVLFCLAGAVLYVSNVKPEFVATTQVVLEPRRSALAGAEAAAMDPGQTLDSAQAESQLQVIRSERNLRFVFDTLDLVNSPILTPDPPGLMQRILGLLPLGGGGPPLTPDEQAERTRSLAFQNFADRVAVRRLGQSYVFEVAFRAPNPTDAARLANSVTASYIRDNMLFKAASVQRGTEYLQGRIADLKAEQEMATEAVKRGVIPDYQFANSDAQVVSVARKPLTKAYPQTTLVLLLAGMFSLLSGVGAVAVHQSLDRKVRSREQVARDLGVDCLGHVPRMPVVGDRQRGRHDWTWDAIRASPNSEFARTYRRLRTRLFPIAAEGQRHASIGIVSCLPREGRSSVALNLARSLDGAASGVTLIDADLHDSAVTRHFAPQAAVGLSDLVANPGGGIAVPAVPVGAHLAVVPATGQDHTADPSLSVGSPAVLQLLAALRGRSHVVVDLPPLSLSPDAQAIGPHLDGVVLVAALNRTTLDQLAEALRTFAASDVRVLGVLINEAGSASVVRGRE